MTAVTALLIGQRAAFAAPLGGTVVEGSAGISQSGNTTNINQSSNKAIINWQGFSIGASETVNFNQPSTSSVTLNRVIGNETSIISGALNANGQVFIVNSAGVLFGKNAQVNVGGLVASTLDISNANFMAGRYTFSGSSTASVVNQGSIRSHGGGYVALLGNTVANDGVISARLGTVAMAAGSQITLNFGGNSLLDVTIDRGTLNALVDNKRAIIADGGQVIMTAKAADGVLSAQVNNSGIIQARTMAALTGGSGKTRAAKTGSIKLIADGGTTTVSGKLDASAPNGGDGGKIETSGNKVKIADGTDITTKAAQGQSGIWLIDPDGFTIAASGGDITGAQLSGWLATNGAVNIASTNGHGTDGNINVNDAVSWSTDSILTLNATNNININAPITAIGTNAGLVMAYGGFAANGAATAGTNYNINMATYGSVTLTGNNATLKINGINYTLIHTMAQLAALSRYNPSTGALNPASGYYALAQNLAPTSDPTSNYSLTGPVIASLTGTLTGLGHTVSGLTLQEDPNLGNYTALIGLVGSTDFATATNPTAVVRDIGIVNANIIAPSGIAGALVGQNFANVSNAYAYSVAVTSPASFAFAGGLVGENSGTISNSHVAFSYISGGGGLGGLVGLNDPSAVIKNSFADSTVVSGTATFVGGLVGATGKGSGAILDSYATNVTVSGRQSVGGLLGANNTRLDNSYATGTVSAVGSNVQSIGGLVGTNIGTISNSHSGVAQINVTGANGIGGLVGTSSSPSSITNSYADTAIVATDSFNVGGLVGSNSAAITGSYATGNVTVIAAKSGGTGVGGLVGSNSASTPISNSYATGNVTVTGAAAGSCPNSRCGIGGLVGKNGGASTISGSHATGNVTAPDSSAVGGLVGDSGGATITNSYATGNVIGRSEVGGLVGRSTGVAFPSGQKGLITGSSASGNVTASAGNAGGLVGLADMTNISGSQAIGNVNGGTNAGGLVGTLGIGGKLDSSSASGNVTSGSDTNAGSLVGNNRTNDPNAIRNSNGTGSVSTPTSRAQEAAAKAAAEAAAKAAAEAAAQAAAKASADAAARSAAQTAQAAARSASTVASNTANSASTAPDGASSAAGTSATTPASATKLDASLKAINDSAKADDQRIQRRVTAAAAAARRNQGGSGGGLGATIRSIEVDGQRFDLQGGGKKDAPAQKPQ